MTIAQRKQQNDRINYCLGFLTEVKEDFCRNCKSRICKECDFTMFYHETVKCMETVRDWNDRVIERECKKERDEYREVGGFR